MPRTNITVASGMPTTLLSEQLKEQTKTRHQELEKQIIPLIRAIRTTDDYARLLMLFYTYFGGLELLVNNTVDHDCLPDYLQRRKISFLRNDLHAMNIEVLPFADGNHLPRIENRLQAFGAMYVMEGSTLGGLHISKMIRAQINSVNADAFSFLNGYTNKTQDMWDTFKKSVDAMLLDKNEAAVVVSAANDSFTRFSSWIRL